ncbi:MAG: AsmA family protein, partial [Gammaproteobacteria bacterium]
DLVGTRLGAAVSSSEFGLESSKLDVQGDITLDMAKQLLTIPAAKIALKAISSNTAKAGFKEVDLNLDGDVRFEMESGEFSAPGVKLIVKASNDQAGSAWKAVTLDMKSDLTAQTKSGSFRTKGMTLKVDAKGDPSAFEDARITLQGDLNMDGNESRLDAPGLNLVAEVTGPSLPGKRIDADLKANARVDLKAMKASARAMSLKALGLDISGDVDVSKLDSDPTASGQVQLSAFNPRELLKRLGQEVPETADPKALTSLSLSTRFEASAKRAKLEKMNANLDNTSTLQGLVDVRSFQGPVAVVRLQLDQIDLDRYLAPKAKGGGSGDGAPAAGKDEPTLIELPVDPLRALNLNAQFNVGKLKVSNLRTEKVRVTVLSKGGILDIKPLTASLYGGNVKLVNRLDVREDTPVIEADTTMKGFQVEPFLTDLQGQSRIRGTTDFSAKISARGRTDKAMIANSNGNARFEFRDGAIKGFNLAQSIRKAKAALKGEKLPDGDAQKETDFTKLSGTARIINGVVDNRDLNAMLPLLRVTGDGTANLNDNTADYTVGAKVVATSKGQGGKDLAELNGVTIPVKIKGPFDDPDIKPDLAGILKSLAVKKVKEKVKEKVEAKIKDKVQDKVQDKIKDQVGEQLLKGLFGR